ncbi:MAG: hypothetical protein OQK98_00910 [Gammaproteobacteria bacterium]|nr:hypothetical protein [Gammaproteobacteria bacterium]
MNYKSEQATHIVNIPLVFHEENLSDESKSVNPGKRKKATPASFSDTQYKVRLIRYTANLKNLIDNPPEFEHSNPDGVHNDQIDNYLWVVGEFINAMHELGHKRK